MEDRDYKQLKKWLTKDLKLIGETADAIVKAYKKYDRMIIKFNKETEEFIEATRIVKERVGFNAGQENSDN